ncbi:MAG: radical SAM protein [Candidatus Eremiobacteraeota bacterium]|nr:radical SAM protein [Candidatus Eremiobacteraeota bacterium]
MSFPFKPKIVGWELTKRCNFQCLHCGTPAGAPRENELTLEESLKLIDDLAGLGCEVLTLSGGEPLMHPHWDKFAHRLREKGIDPYMITNGYYLEENIEKILATPLRRIGLSIDGTAEIHDHIRQHPGSYERALRGARRAKEKGIAVGVVTHVSRYNFDALDEMERVFRGVPMDFWQIQVTFLSGRMKEHGESVLEPSELPRVAAFVEKARIGRDMLVCAGDNLGYYSCRDIVDKPWKGCHAGRWVLGIESDGTLKGCLSLPGEFREGNIRTRPLGELWEDRSLFKLNRYFNPDDLAGYCSECDKKLDCRGGCKVTAFSSTGNAFDNPYCLYRVEKEASCGGGSPKHV